MSAASEPRPSTKAEAAADQIRVIGFNNLEGDVLELVFMAEIASYLCENMLLASRTNDEDFVNVRMSSGRLIDFAVAKVASMAKAVEEKWSEAHHRACQIERDDMFPRRSA